MGRLIYLIFLIYGGLSIHGSAHYIRVQITRPWAQMYKHKAWWYYTYPWLRIIHLSTNKILKVLQLLPGTNKYTTELGNLCSPFLTERKRLKLLARKNSVTISGRSSQKLFFCSTDEWRGGRGIPYVVKQFLKPFSVIFNWWHSWSFLQPAYIICRSMDSLSNPRNQAERNIVRLIVIHETANRILNCVRLNKQKV